MKLDSEGDWIEFMKKSGAVSGDGSDEKPIINLEKLLRYCFDIAFKMPPSPSGKTMRQNSGGSDSAKVSPPPIQI